MLLSEGDPMMTDAKLGPKMQEWQVEHTNLYLKSGGKEGHVMKRTPPGDYPEMDVYSLLLTTTGRKSGERFVFPLYYGTTGDSYIIVASKGGAPDHPGWYKNLVAILRSRSRSERKSSRRRLALSPATSARSFGRWP